MLMFLIGCMGARLGLTYAAYRFPALLPWLGLLALGISIGFAMIYITAGARRGSKWVVRPSGGTTSGHSMHLCTACLPCWLSTASRSTPGRFSFWTPS